MKCAEFEILLCDYVDGTLRGEQKTAFERHLPECASCAELARDAGAAVAFIERAAVVQAPQELVTRIVFELQAGASRAAVKPSWWRRWFGRWLEPILQPRFAMGMAMTVLSFAMLGRFSGIQVRQLKPSDLDPVKIWMAVDDRVNRTWDRAVKYYQNLRWVYEIQSRLKEWSDQSDAESQNKSAPGSRGEQPAQNAGERGKR